jgi:phage-related protein
MADDINLPNLVSHLQVNLGGTSGEIDDARRQGSAMGSALGSGINRQLDNLLRHLPQVTIDGDSEPLDRDLARVHRQLAMLDSQRIGVDVSITDALRQLEDLEANLQRIGDEHHDVNVRAATAAAARQLEELRRAARQVDDTDVDIDVDVDTDGPDRLTRILRRIPAVAGRAAGSLAGVGAATAGVGAAVPILAGVVSTLQNVAPAAGVAVTGMAALQLAQGAVKLAAIGMDDALTAALDPSKAAEFGEALEKLSPEARKFATAVRDAAPALRSMQQDVQDRVFRGLADNLQRTGRVVLPVLRKNLLNTGTALNEMASGALDAGRELATSGTLGKGLGSASKGLRNLSKVPRTVVKALGQIAAAAGPSFERLTEGAAEAAEDIGKRLNASFESGQMQESIEGAIDLLKDLMEVGGNVGEIFRGIFSAVPEGGGIIGMLQDVTQAIADAVNSPEVQEGLTALFEVMGTLGETVAPLLAQALGMIAPILAEIGPPMEELIVALGEALQPILEALEPVLVEVAGVFREIVAAITPLLPPISELIVDLLPLLQYFLRGVSVIIREVIAPALEMFAVGLQKIVEWLGILVGWLAGQATEGVKGFSQVLRGDFESASDSANASIANMSIDVARNVSSLPSKITAHTLSFVSVLRSMGENAKVSVTTQVFDMIDRVRGMIAGLPGIVRGIVFGFIDILPQAGRDLIQGFIIGIKSAIPGVRDVLTGLTGSLTDWKGPPAKDARILTPAGRLLIEGFIKGIDGTTAKLRSKLASITKALPSNVRSGYGKTLKKAITELEKLTTRRDAVIKKLAAGQKKLDDLLKARSKAAGDITKGILGEADITSGHADVNSVSAITVELQQALKRTQEFQKNIVALRKAGLRSDLLQQIADAGVDAGGATAAALARATPAELKKINGLQAQLAKSAKSTGDTVGDALYSAGIRAAQGLVEGLKSQEKTIEKQMVKIAKGMITTTKKAHKTRSPSREFAWIGEMDGRGLEAGLLATVGRVRAAARTVAGAALDVASGAGAALAVTPTAGQLAAVTAGTVGGGDQYNTFHLYETEASPDGVLRALSWRGLVGRR